MVPPRRYKYFFTHNRKQICDSDINTLKSEIPIKYTYEMYCEPVTFKVQKVNYRDGKPKKIVNAWDQLIVVVQPRQSGLVTKKQKIPWTFKDSLWHK